MRHPSIRKKLSLISPTSGCRSVGIVRSRPKATELVRNACIWVAALLSKREV
jgi:hypothetical protein